MGVERERDSAMEQFVLRWEKDSVAAAKREISVVFLILEGGDVEAVLGAEESLVASVAELNGSWPALSWGLACGEGGGVG